MPTAAKIFASIAFLVICYFAAEVYKATLPAGTVVTLMSPICAALGALCGWFVMGPLVGDGYGVAIGSGIRTSVTAVFFALVIFAGDKMVILSMQHRYRGPIEALQAMLAIAGDYGLAMLRADVLVILLVGGSLGGILAEWSSRKWR
ncbi:MAG: TrgA family protein [Paracoccaceae bacterium]|nr:TrgA family protein [Paracoccaceae bacterium]